MCEIAILDTDRYSVSQLAEAATRIYQSMRHSLGIVGIEDTGDGSFRFGVYKAVEPDTDHLHEFLHEQTERADRVLIHGRLATTGAVTQENAHPLAVECEECEIDYIAHNGIVYGHDKARQKLEQRDHTFATDVDSETIAHAHGKVPETWDDSRADVFGHQPAYTLLNEDRVYIYTNGQYTLSESGHMARGYRDFGPDTGHQAEVILHPEGQNAE